MNFLSTWSVFGDIRSFFLGTFFYFKGNLSLSSWPSINLGPLAHPGYHGLGECVSATQGFGRFLSSIAAMDVEQQKRQLTSHQSRKIFSQMFCRFFQTPWSLGMFRFDVSPKKPPFLLTVSNSLEILPGCRSVEITSNKTGCQDMFFF